ncbi:hypothetical protein C0J52_15391 [Blattella germanica]|nr:hypothetical protein C0J52_15391 [Blattella germanica]
MSMILFLYPHYRQIYQSYATASSTPSLRSTWIHFTCKGRIIYTTGLMSAGSQGEHTSSTYNYVKKLGEFLYLLVYQNIFYV